MASDSRKTTSAVGVRRPSSDSTPTANAMSVAMGMPQPSAPSPPALKAVKIRAGTIMPPSAAIAGRAAARGSRSSPRTSSRLISKATTKKKNAMARSLTQVRRSRSRWIQSATWTEITVVQSVS